MSKPPAFVLLSAKVEDADGAFEHMVAIDMRQAMLRDKHPALYSRGEHAELLAVNLQGLYTKLEGLLGDLIKEVDGDLPRSEAWHKDLLVLASRSNHPRPGIISRETFELMAELLAFRHVVRSRYANELRPDEVFKNFGLAKRLLPSIKGDLDAFVVAFGQEPGPPTEPDPERMR